LFDGAFLAEAGLPIRDVHDLMHMSRLLTADPAVRAGNALEDIARRELDRTLDKSHQKSDWSGSLTGKQLAYAAEDAEVTALALPKLQAKIIEAGLDQVAVLERRATPAILWMAGHGVPFNKQKWDDLATLAEEEVRALEEQLNAAATPRKTEPWNWNSPAQIKKVMALAGRPVADAGWMAMVTANHPIDRLKRAGRGDNGSGQIHY
jgi:ribonuclease D